ncbi:MAG TPA: hypothetical protein VIS48_16930 [Candidatus Kryptonia bacterium]
MEKRKMRCRRDPISFLARLVQGGCYALVFMICISGCTRSGRPDLRVTDVFKSDSLFGLVVNNLSEKRIVMLGDNEHGNGYYMRLVTAVLNCWVDDLEMEQRQQRREIDWHNLHPGHSLPTKLFLFVEQFTHLNALESNRIAA